jgi:cobalt/nickel transport system permease protein
MHIPDGYLGPQTYLPAFAVMAGFWAAGLAHLKRTLRLRQVPLLALGAAFSFVIMMFNVPIPFGTTGHAIGTVLVAILFGPWAAVVVVSLAVIVQALLFGDGGITAIGANCFNMAVVCGFVGWGAYRLIAGRAPANSARHWIGGTVGGYLGLNAAALTTGIEFGLQPLLAHAPDGQALYCPFGLHIAVPAMAVGHLLVFGFVEAVVTGLVVAYLQRTAPEMLAATAPRPAGNLVARLAIGLGILVVLAPVGLLLPSYLRSGAAWGEWSGDEVRQELARTGGAAYVPRGIAHAEEHGWRAPMPDYALPGQEDASAVHASGTYIFAGALGVLGVGLVLLLLLRPFARKDKPNDPPAVAG